MVHMTRRIVRTLRTSTGPGFHLPHDAVVCGSTYTGIHPNNASLAFIAPAGAAWNQMCILYALLDEATLPEVDPTASLEYVGTHEPEHYPRAHLFLERRGVRAPGMPTFKVSAETVRAAAAAERARASGIDVLTVAATLLKSAYDILKEEDTDIRRSLDEMHDGLNFMLRKLEGDEDSD